MSKSLSLKLKIILLGVFLTIVSILVGTMTTAKASIVSVTDVNLSMKQVAEVIVEGDDGVNGLKFKAQLSESDYNSLNALVGKGKTYSKIETGLIIAPSYYVDEVAIDEESLFGADATYDYAKYVNGEWVYTGNKIRVININENSWTYEGGAYTYSGAIVDVLEANEDEIFYATAYLKATDNQGTATYNFANSYTASVVGTAVNAINNDLLTEEQIAWVKENWVSVNSYESTTEYLVDVKDYYTYDIANGVYEEDAIEIINKFGKENLKWTLKDVNGKTVNTRLLDVQNSDNLRLWTVEASIGDVVVYKGKVDVYNSTKSAVWNDMSATSGIENAVLVRNEDVKIDGVMQKVKTTNTYAMEDNKSVIKITSPIESFYVGILPIHSKAYYETYQDGDYTFSYTWKYTTTATYNSGAQGFYFINGTAWNGSNNVNTWYSNNLTLKQIVENWDGFTDFSTRVWGERHKTGMFCVYNILNSTGNVDIFLNFSLIDNKAVNTLANLNEIEDDANVSLSTIINEGIYSNLVNSYPNAKWYLADTVKGTEIEILDKDKVDLTKFDKKAYTLKVVDNQIEVFSADFDIYDSSEPLVWNTVSNENIDYVKVYQFVNAKQGDGLLENAVSITDDGFFRATSNEFYYYSYSEGGQTVTVSPLEYMSVTVLPLHSKSYYQRFYGEGLVLRMRMIKDGLLDFSTVQFLDTNYHNYWAKTHGEITIRLDKLIDNWIAYTGTGMTTNTDSWTVMTRASGNVKDAMQVFNISLGEITLTQPATESTGTESLKGRQVTVIGDSISTWNYEADGSTYPHVSNNAANKQNIVKADTWWQQVIDNYDMELVVNKATSGATAGHGVLMGGAPTSNSKLNICSKNTSLSEQGVDPDIVLLYIGMNDMCRGSTIIKDGDDINSNAFYEMIPTLFKSYQDNYEANKSDYGMALSQSLGLDTYARAYAYILYSIQTNYPNADIICVNMPAKMSTAPQYNEVINTVAGHYGVPVVDLYSAFVKEGGNYADKTYCYDNLHPNAYGFDVMSNAVIAKMDEIYGK